jgi:hypothetical protein
MTPKRTAILLIALLILVVGTLSAIKSSSVRALPQATAQPGTLDWYAQQAQAQGVSGYTFESGNFEYSEPATWDTVLGLYSFLIVEPVQVQSYPSSSEDTIYSWYKFRVVETLQQKDSSSCPGCPPLPDSVPANMTPPQAGEIALVKSSGVLVRNGITLAAQESVFPDFTMGQRYLLIVELNPSTRIGSLDMGPLGVYLLDSSGHMTALVAASFRDNPFEADIANRYGNSVNQLRASLNPTPTATPTPTPTSSCDPDGSRASACYDSGGSWSPATCKCTDSCSSPNRPWLCY